MTWPQDLATALAPRAAPRPRPGTDPQAAAAMVQLEVTIRTLAGHLERESDWRAAIAAAITPIEVPAIGAFTAAQIPYLQGTWGPNDGWAWAIQRLTVATLAATDALNIYRGASTADANGAQNLLQGFQGSNGTVQAWTPGRTGCMLAANQNLIITGTLAGGPYMLNADVIQIESWAVPYYLL